MQYSTGQPSVSDVLDDNIPDVPDEHEPVNGMYLLIGLCVLIFLSVFLVLLHGHNQNAILALVMLQLFIVCRRLRCGL